MKPYAKYIYMTPVSDVTRHSIFRHEGAVVPEFSPVWVSLLWFLRPVNPKSIQWKPEHIVLLQSNMRDIRLVYIPEMKNFSYGCFNNDALLVRFEDNPDNTSKITVWFFKDKKSQAAMLYNQWISCQLILN